MYHHSRSQWIEVIFVVYLGVEPYSILLRPSIKHLGCTLHTLSILALWWSVLRNCLAIVNSLILSQMATRVGIRIRKELVQKCQHMRVKSVDSRRLYFGSSMSDLRGVQDLDSVPRRMFHRFLSKTSRGCDC
jgi:hypothetical protein